MERQGRTRRGKKTKKFTREEKKKNEEEACLSGASCENYYSRFFLAEKDCSSKAGIPRIPST
jgi:hypothetical protein